MVGDDGGNGEGAGWWNPRVAEVLLLQVLEDAAGVNDAPMEVQPSHDHTGGNTSTVYTKLKNMEQGFDYDYNKKRTALNPEESA